MKNRWRKSYFLFILTLLASSSIETVAAINSSRIVMAENSGADGEFGVTVGDESSVGVEVASEAVGDGLVETEAAGVGVGEAALGPNVIWAFVVVHGICWKLGSSTVPRFVVLSRVVWLKVICEVPSAITVKSKVTRVPLPLALLY